MVHFPQRTENIHFPKYISKLKTRGIVEGITLGCPYHLLKEKATQCSRIRPLCLFSHFLSSCRCLGSHAYGILFISKTA